MRLSRTLHNRTSKLIVAKRQLVPYNKEQQKGDDKMTEIMKKLQAVQLTPKQRRALGLSPDWNKQISPSLVSQVVQSAEEHKRAMKELAKL